MTGAQGEGRGESDSSDGALGDGTGDSHVDQIEYLLQQSTQGLHFIFDHHDVAAVLKSVGSSTALDVKLMDKVQVLLTGLLGKKTITEKRSFLESLPRGDYELLITAYFQLVDKTILARPQRPH